MTTNSELRPSLESIENAKVVLRMYGKIETAVKSIEKQILKAALGSFYYKRGGGVLDECNKILSLIEQKENYLAFGDAMDRTLAQLKPAHKEFLEMRFLQKMKFSDIADHFEITLRYCFRLYDSAVTAFCKKMKGDVYFAAYVEKMQKLPLYDVEKRRSEEKLKEILQQKTTLCERGFERRA